MWVTRCGSAGSTRPMAMRVPIWKPGDMHGGRRKFFLAFSAFRRAMGGAPLLLYGLQVLHQKPNLALATTSPSKPPPAISFKRSPQTGISRWPCAGTQVRPSMYAAISGAGKCPPRRWAMRVRSAGGGWRAVAAGPSPRPSSPWQALQYRTKCWCPTRTASSGVGGGSAASAIASSSHHPMTRPHP
jgi:hypothetical protein